VVFLKGDIMTKEVLDRAWNMGKDIKVRYRNFNTNWVKMPKPQDEGMGAYTNLKWNLEKYEYLIGWNGDK
jgi:hypothetical protein